MEWLFLPKPSKYIGPCQSHGVHISQRRRRQQLHLQQLYKSVAGVFLIIIALRVGIISALTLHDPLGFWVMVQSDGIPINVPKIKQGTQLTTPRLYFIAVITASGEISFDGASVTPDTQDALLEMLKARQPRYRCLFVVDKDAPMQHVHAVHRLLKKHQINQVFYVASHEAGRSY